MIVLCSWPPHPPLFSVFISLSVFHPSVSILVPREKHLDLDLLQTGIVSFCPPYYLFCFSQTNSLLVCRFFFFSFLFFRLSTRRGDNREARGRDAFRIDMSGQEGKPRALRERANIKRKKIFTLESREALYW